MAMHPERVELRAKLRQACCSFLSKSESDLRKQHRDYVSAKQLSTAAEDAEGARSFDDYVFLTTARLSDWLVNNTPLGTFMIYDDCVRYLLCVMTLSSIFV
jgi:hypothetical protein